MSPRIHVGCCGWSYFQRSEFPSVDFSADASKLQSYAKLFSCVEINSTFYRLPRVNTAEQWHQQAAAVNPHFEFTVKAFRGITHLHRFRSQASRQLFTALADIARSLHARIILFQTPPTFQPGRENERAFRTFFESVERNGFDFAWEPRGAWHEHPATIASMCHELEVIHCVDPLRHQPLAFGKRSIAYFRLHGFGTPSMYRYDFSRAELQNVEHIIRDLTACVNDVYLLFNNVSCYRNAVSFQELLARS